MYDIEIGYGKSGTGAPMVWGAAQSKPQMTVTHYSAQCTASGSTGVLVPFRHRDVQIMYEVLL